MIKFEKIIRIISILLISVFLIMVSVVIIMKFKGMYINTSNSLPKGIYQKSQQINPIMRNDFVIFCAPERDEFQIAIDRNYLGVGLCRNNTDYFIKRVIGVPGDKVEISKYGISINDKPIENTLPLFEDGDGLELKPYFLNKKLSQGEIIVIGDNSKYSFDSRYFGLIYTNEITNKVKPLFIFK